MASATAASIAASLSARRIGGVGAERGGRRGGGAMAAGAAGGEVRCSMCRSPRARPPRRGRRSPRYERAHGCQTLASACSRKTRLARAFSIVSCGVAPILQHSTMMGPLKPADFSFHEDAGEIDLARPNWIITSPLGAPAILRAEARHVLGDGAKFGDRVLAA